MRKKSSILNMLTAYIGQILAALIVLVTRTFFVHILGKEYLGLNGLFSNILTVLSLVELGVGPAIVYSLYKPLADNDKEKIKSLMALFKKLYIIIGIVILVLGISLTPFLSFFIKDMPDIPNIRLIYCLFVLNSSISYFFSYKRSLINSDKNRYILPIFKYTFYVILNILQIIFLIITKNYIVFLLLQILSTFMENYLVSLKADKLYPYLKDKKTNKLDKETDNKIKKNIKAMIGHKLGSVVVRSTDNILISKLINLASVGLYSNYFLVTNALDNISNQLFNSLTASAGNLYATENPKESYRVFKSVFFTDFVIYCIFCTLLVNVINPFISIWLGKGMLFSLPIVIVIILNFYLSGMRKSIFVFRDAMGLYYEDRFKPLFEASINLVTSIILAKKFGIIGIFIGTTISTVTTCLWVEPLVLYKYGFKENVLNYFKTYIKYLIITLLSILISNYICQFITGITILEVIIKTLISLLISILIIFILFHNTEEYKYVFNTLKNIKKIVRKDK